MRVSVSVSILVCFPPLEVTRVSVSIYRRFPPLSVTGKNALECADGVVDDTTVVEERGCPR